METFRLLALHRQGARGVPSFNACRETCREIAYHYNLLTLAPDAAADTKRLTMMAMLVRHLAFFVGGKLQVEGLGDFCCSEFRDCTTFGQDVDACWACLEQGGGPLCDPALACFQESPCAQGPGQGICDTGLTTDDPRLDACLGENCCEELNDCLDNEQACFQCFENGGGPICDPFIGCANESCDLGF